LQHTSAGALVGNAIHFTADDLRSMQQLNLRAG
jgi:hypothetical protein